MIEDNFRSCLASGPSDAILYKLATESTMQPCGRMPIYTRYDHTSHSAVLHIRRRAATTFVVADPRVFLFARCVGVGASSDMLPNEFRTPAMWFLGCRMRAWPARQGPHEIENPTSAQRSPTPAHLGERSPRSRPGPSTTRAMFGNFRVFEVKVSILKSQSIFDL